MSVATVSTPEHLPAVPCPTCGWRTRVWVEAAPGPSDWACVVCDLRTENALQNADHREEIRDLRSLLEQACRAYVGEYGDELSREALDNILTIIGPKRLGLDFGSSQEDQ